MTNRLTKTIKITDETHKAIRIAAAQEEITMAEWLANVVLSRTTVQTPRELVQRLPKREQP